ncbi:hypothetical protein UFOVP84_32 [uncultured Caudovirales phage]|uniref:Uncharacterized protein n=1 Tax=uncultured Caudovirales phage TaxID=2100421 RepID=A0A6J5KWH9_9CAUD|nr:hypothetical protein UFOVP84_32 [uncultured Caudovirales phage]
MANTAGLCQSFKKDILNGVHAFSVATGGKGTTDTFYGALYSASASPSLTPTTVTTYTATAGELANGNGYTTGGQVITNAVAPNTTTGTAYWTPSANLSWTAFTATAFDTLLIYNNTVSGKNAVGIFTFASQTITAGTFTLTMPTNDSTNALIRIA